LENTGAQKHWRTKTLAHKNTGAQKHWRTNMQNHAYARKHVSLAARADFDLLVDCATGTVQVASDANAIAHLKRSHSRRTAWRHALALHGGATGQRRHPGLVLRNR
jgi:hypothetical protein